MASAGKSQPSDNPLDGLDTYNAKRDFKKTTEPAGDPAAYGQPKAAGEALQFLVQKHAATRLHYDFRLEFNGVLLSWAVTKGPSPDPSQKRLAVRTEDHPLSYASFEGTIPKGEYGGGTVMLWDQGTWEPVGNPKAGLKKGKLEFSLVGERMRGAWVLVRMRVKEKTSRENWLLIKSRDEYAIDEADKLIEDFEVSVTTQRNMAEIAGAVTEPKRRALSVKSQSSRSATSRKRRTNQQLEPLAAPVFSNPQLATLVDSAPDSDEWLNEAKFDGYRLLCSIGKGGVRCYTRSGRDWTAKFNSIANALAGIKCRSALIDGEVIAAGDNGGSDFSALQLALSSTGDSSGALEFMAFDLLEIDGEDWRDKPQIERKERLREALQGLPLESPVRFSEHVVGNGPEVFKALCAAGREGIIAKRASASYRGARSKSWLKIKCSRRQEFVIGGFSPSSKPGRPFASLLIGSFDGNRLIYHGRIGTGFNTRLMDELSARMRPMVRKTSPFAIGKGAAADPVPAAIARNAQWLTPKLVVEVEFAELTDSGHVRHGVFQGLREDKSAKDVHFEQPAHAVPSARPAQEKPSGRKSRTESAQMKQASSIKEKDEKVQGITLTHPDRILFPEQGLSKLDLAHYYEAIAERMLPLMSDFPLSLVRCPSGRSSSKKSCFFQKHASDGFPEALRSISITESSGKEKDYLYLSDAAGLVAGVQMGTLEYHIWGSKRDRLEKPSRVVFDLDPDEGLEFKAVKEAAELVRGGLQVLGLESFPLVTGGKGVHVVVPLRRTAEWPQVTAFAKAFALYLVQQFPDRYTATMSKKKREGKLFLDWFRNDRGSTAIAPYSTRAREGAPVATPVSWEELAALNAASTFRPADVSKRLDEADPWADYDSLSQSITREMLDRLESDGN